MRSRDLGAVLAATLCLAGCGSDGKHDVVPPPTLPRQIAIALAERSDEVARVLDSGDECRALTLAAQLRQQTIAAINTGRVPGVFQEPLLDRVNSLATRIRCVPPASEQDQDEESRGHGKDKKKGHKGKD